MRIIRWLGIGAIAFAVLVGGIAVGARFSDGPLAIFAGGPLVAGEFVTGPEPDWTFASAIDTVELQLLEPARSRTTWILEHEGKIYIPCGYLNSALGRIWKKWPIEAEKDPRAIVRIEGKRYGRELLRVTDPALFADLSNEIGRKYGAQVPSDAAETDALRIYELAPRLDVAAPPSS